MNLFKSKLFYIFCALGIGLVIASAFLYTTNEGVATEFRQIRQPSPNRFFIGMDVSATIDPDTLKTFKDNVISRLSNFVGDEAASYAICSFGSPGCDKNSLFYAVPSGKLLPIPSPKDDTAFKWDVTDRMSKITVSQIPENGRTSAPLTTPLHYLLDTVLKDKVWSGARIIIFSDLMNDDSDCRVQHPFPERTIKEFGKNKDGQIVFIYPTPQLSNTPEFNKRILKKQQEFITKMQNLSSEGSVRAFFYHIPDEPKKQSGFIQSQLQNSIPATMIEIIWERASRIVDTMVSAVRG